MAAGALGSVSNRLRHENGDTHVGVCDDVFSDAGSTPAASTIRLTSRFAFANREVRSWQAIGQGECPDRAQRVEGPAPGCGLRTILLLYSLFLGATMASSSSMHWLYILRCADGSLYVGETPDVTARLVKHHEGGSPHTATRRPVSLAYSEAFQNRILALGRERQIKRWTRAKKEALIAGDLVTLKKL